MLEGRDFAIRGWHRLVNLADYLSYLVDGRSVGFFGTDDPQVFERVTALASVVKAAAQWFASDQRQVPVFVEQAQKYLAEGLHDKPIDVPWAAAQKLRFKLRSGPVVRRKGVAGPGGRLHALAKLKALFAEIMAELTQDDLRIHLEAYRDAAKPRPKQQWLLPNALTGNLFGAFAHGTLSDLLHEQHFEFASNIQVPAAANAMARYLEQYGDLGLESKPERMARLEDLARHLIEVALSAIGIRVPKDLFRDRRAIP